MTPELIGILVVGATLIGVGTTMIGLLLALWRHARADTQALRQEVRADLQSFREEVRADLADVRSDLANLRTDVQALTERMSRVEGVIEGLFAGRDRRNDAA